MTDVVPVCDTICRFVRPRDWSYADDCPRSAVFGQTNPSAWNVDSLTTRGVHLDELKTSQFAQGGHVNCTVRDYLDLAREVTQETGEPCDIRIVWRPDDFYIPEAWRSWRYAHVQIEMADGVSKLPSPLRWKLCRSSRVTAVPPYQ